MQYYLSHTPRKYHQQKLCKHIAAVSQLLNLFLGRDAHIHREFNQFPEDTLQLAKVSHLLLAMEQCVISSFKEKTLDQIDVTVDHVIDDAESHW